MLVRITLLVTLFIASSSGQGAAPSDAVLSSDEYQVMAAVIDFFRAAGIASHPLIANRTSIFECGSTCNGMSMGGCNGLRGSDETPQERLQIVKRDLARLEQNTISDFMSKNNRCASIDSKLPTEAQYLTFGVSHSDARPPGWEHPDLFYFSRVGFNAEHSQALVHVSFMSGTNASDSGGKYLLFIKANGRWKREGSSAVWLLIPPRP